MSWTRKRVPVLVRLADDPKIGKLASRLSRQISAWNGPALTSMAIVPSQELPASAAGSSRRISGCEASYGAITPSGRSYSSVIAATIARIAPLSGALLADTLRYTIATTLTFTIGYLMGYHPAGGPWGVLGASLLVIGCSWAISWIFALFGVLARTASSVQGISMLVLFPLTFLSNAYVPVETLPWALGWFATINPVSHLVSGVRELANEGVVGPDVWMSVIAAVVIVVIFAPLTVRAYMRKA